MHDANIEGFQLSPPQRHLWRLTRHQPEDTSPYVAHAVVHIRGQLDVALLKRVLEECPARHEILRTTFYGPEEIAMPLQVISPIGESGRSSFFNLTSTSPDDHVLTIDTSALICDAAGLNALIADIAGEYDARAHGQTRPFEGLQYPDASIWLNDTLESPEAVEGRRFWESQHFSAAVDARLPFERPSDVANPPFAPRDVTIRLSPDSVSAARAVAASSNTSLEMFALTCWQCVLQRILDADSIVVGFMSDGRAYPELRTAVGLFSRCLPLAGDLPRDVPFDEAMSRLVHAVHKATQWGECFEWPRESGETVPFVPLAFEHRELPGRPVAQDVVFEITETRACVDRFTLKICWESAGERLPNLRLEYNAAVLNEEDVTSLSNEFVTLFAAAAQDPRRALGELRLLTAAQEHEILSALGHADAVAASGPALVHRRFEEQAARQADQTAIVFETTKLTYGELDARSNQLAHLLNTRGVGPDVVVGLCVQRSVDIAVGILGILKAGGAYVALDPQVPAVRLNSILQESGAHIVVSHASLAGLLGKHVRTVLLDRDRETLEAFPCTSLATATRPEHLAYVLFTSGSSGKPKGVGIEHRQLIAYVDAVTRRLDLPAAATFATVTTFAADLGHTAIYPALMGGGCLHIISEERASDAHAFAEYASRCPIDVLKIVPSHLTALLTGSRPADVLPRRRLVLGGEALSWDLVDEIQRLAPSCTIFNHYGPTETTVGATMYEVPGSGTRPPTTTVPIGGPLEHALVYPLDAYRQLVPVWSTGELYIGGAGVARGYLADNDLTAAKFVPDPRGQHAGARMYKTGDRVRLLPGGMCEFLGRLDSQVKIRGFRVELGEIAATLSQHPSVRHAEVLMHVDKTGPRLAAFLLQRGGPRPSADDLREFLQQRGLPDYVVPSAFVPVDTMPVTLNGKLDRQRLLELLAAPAPSPEIDEPLSEWESIIAAIWQNALSIDQVQASDNFYDLGGHSLLAIQVVSALERQADVQVSPRELVFHTLKQFAALCASKRMPKNDARTSHV